jgi:hypothetical protein
VKENIQSYLEDKTLKINNRIIKKKEEKEEGNTCSGKQCKSTPCIAILISLAKTLVPSYYCLYSLFNKIRDKGKIVSAGY